MQPGNSSRQNLILLMIGSGLVLVAFAAFFMLGHQDGVSLPKGQEKPETVNLAALPLAVDFPAPDIRLTDLQGRPVAFTDYKGQVILYNAWATWCPPCKEEMPTLEAYYRAHRQEGFAVIAVEDGESLAEVAAYVKAMGLTFPVWPDLKWVASETFGINNLPTSYVIDRSGRARLTWRGAITRAILEKYVTPLLKEP
ncbi:MAG: TlpA disulfide reductase family protein [Anaerolineales bacterium]